MRASLVFLFAGLAVARAEGGLSIDLAARRALIAAPREAAAEAARLAAALSAAGCAAPEVVSDAAAPAPGRPLVLLGNAPGNRLLRRLYFEYYDFTDLAFPGPGNAVVRTVPAPFDTGEGVVVVGASDAEGLALAVDTLAAEVKAASCRLGFLNRVVAGPGRRLADPFATRLDPAFDWAATETGAGSWDYMMAIAHCGLGYLYTGNQAYLPLFGNQLRSFYERRVLPMEGKPQMHGFIYWLVNVWDLIGAHPYFDRDRREIDTILLAILRSPEGPRRIANEARHYQIRGNHSTRTALDAYFGGRWAWRRLGLAEGKEWMDLAARFFAPQLTSAKPAEDSWGHQWNASLLNTATYALATGNTEYFASPALRLAAERALIAHSHREAGPHAYLALVAAATGDARYLSLTRAVDPALTARSFLPATGGADEALRPFAFFRQAAFHEGALGAAVAPLDRLWYDTIDSISSLSPSGAFARTVNFEDTFDKICLREGYGANDFYLLFDGLSGGAHGYQDAACIKRYVEGGVDWLGIGQDAATPATVRQENGVYVALDGAGPGRVHRFARKLYAGARGEYLFAAAALTGVGDADWERHIIRRRGRWTAVIDRAVARRAGDLLFERHWWLKGEAAEDGAWVNTRSGSMYLHLGAAGIAETSLGARLTQDAYARPFRGAADRLERVRAPVAAGGAIEAAALLYTDREARAGRYRIVRAGGAWLVEGEGEHIRVAPDTAEPLSAQAAAALVVESTPRPQPLAAPPLHADWKTARLPARITAIAPAAAGWAAGDAQGNLLWQREGSAAPLQVKRPQAISALHFYPGGHGAAPGLLAGEEDGSLTLLNQDGSVRWSLRMKWIAPPFSYWTEGRSRAREIDSAVLDGGGAPAVLVANSDRHLWIFDAAGRQRARASVEWGVLTALTVAPVAGKVRILGGTSRPSIYGRLLAFDATGKQAGDFTRGGLTDWSFPSSMRDVRLDGQTILVAVDTSMRQLIAFNHDGRVAWEADVAGGPAALALLDDGPVCAGGAGYVTAFTHTGTRRWTLFLGEPAKLLAAGAALDVVTGRAVWRFSRDGRPIGTIALPAAVSAVPRPGAHRIGDRFLIGLEDGSILSRSPE